ncbi:hypothetical protein Y88_1732 [Novosphingobium nitrogenifigens DSM 19370]|uniref:Uncharacterized protein n=1 Tax=Novosphingobium nitrogenifigens DSM 19370 TaxID=983920 RepID=F1Z3M9_9SPHN|nr:hypothetical protein Y88_1732 [Novosphingobium nitrogenifigens DSM 19370]
MIHFGQYPFPRPPFPARHDLSIRIEPQRGSSQIWDDHRVPAMALSPDIDRN